jgi:hypothetical protein
LVDRKDVAHTFNSFGWALGCRQDYLHTRLE